LSLYNKFILVLDIALYMQTDYWPIGLLDKLRVFPTMQNMFIGAYTFIWKFGTKQSQKNLWISTAGSLLACLNLFFYGREVIRP